MALMLNFSNQFMILPVLLLVMFFLQADVYRFFLRWKFLVFLGILVLGVPLFAGEKNSTILGISYSRDLFRSSVVMAERSIILLMGLKFFTSRISVEQMSEAIAKSRFKQFSRVFSLSMESLPEVKTITLDTLREFRQESRGKRRFSNVSGYSIKLMVRILHYAGYNPQGKSINEFHDE